MKYVLGLILLLTLTPSSEKKSFSILVADVAWESLELPGMPEGIEQRVLHNNKENQLISAIVKLPKGHQQPKHYHTMGHSDYVLKGRLRSPEGDLTPGMFLYFAANERHGPFIALEETELLFYTDGPFDFIVGDTE